LFLPKVLAALRVAWADPQPHGGRLHLALSLAGEMVFSALLAPIRMLFHTQFVTMALAGRAVRWKSPPRGDNETDWKNAIARHGTHTLVGILWAAIVWWLNPSYLWWLLPVVGALILSIPLSVFASRIGLGRRLRRRKYFLIPEESHPPPVIRATRRYWHHAPQPADVATAIVDPVTNALICAQAVGGTSTGRNRDFISTAIAERALRDGLDALSGADKNQLIADPAALSALHWAVWTSAARHPSWVTLTAQVPARIRSATADAATERDAHVGDVAGVASNAAGG
jgi:membrane glycosyltransferase